jgi:hypothetical protein
MDGRRSMRCHRAGFYVVDFSRFTASPSDFFERQLLQCLGLTNIKV